MIVTDVVALTVLAVIVNVAEIAPGETITDAGTVAALELDVSATITAAVGAGEDSVTVP